MIRLKQQCDSNIAVWLFSPDISAGMESSSRRSEPATHYDVEGKGVLKKLHIVWK